MPPSADSELGACIELAITNSYVSAAVDRELERRGISVTQAGLLRIIDVYGPITPSGLERLTKIPPSTLRGRIGVLVGSRYVARTRSTKDGRSFLLEITPHGRNYLAKVMPLVAELERRLDRELDGGLETLREMLARIRAHVSAPEDDAIAR